MQSRPNNALRPITLTPHYLPYPEGSVLIEFGNTRVLCTASIEERVPPWLAGKGRGWVTAEYDMLPRATHTRNPRDSHKGKINGRTQEISRLIGRALRSCVNLELLGERVITIDCDVLSADGGTRTTSITGGFIALAFAIQHLVKTKNISPNAIKQHVAAISVGVVQSECYLDLDYALDSQADVDMNIVMLEDTSFVELQGTGENASFHHQQLNELIALAQHALPTLIEAQKMALTVPFGQRQTLTLP